MRVNVFVSGVYCLNVSNILRKLRNEVVRDLPVGGQNIRLSGNWGHQQKVTYTRSDGKLFNLARLRAKTVQTNYLRDFLFAAMTLRSLPIILMIFRNYLIASAMRAEILD